MTKFVGRDKVLATLHEQLQQTERVAISSVSGMGGIGKTELALQYARYHWQQETYPGGVCWLRVLDGDVELQFLSFARVHLGLKLPDDLNMQEQIDFCWQKWPNGDVLIVFDDVAKYEEIANILPSNPRFKVLLTTRKKHLADSWQQLKLEVLDDGAALELLVALVGEERIQREADVAKLLCGDLGYLPLGLELVGRYLQRKRDLSLVEMRKQLDLKHRALQKKDRKGASFLDMTAQRGVEAAFDLSWSELDEEEKEVGCRLSLFAPAPIPWHLVQQCLSEMDESDVEEIRDDVLVNLSLLQRSGENIYQLHPLIRKFLVGKLEQFDSVDEWKRNFCHVMAKKARKIPHNITLEEVEEVEVNIPHIEEVAEHLTEYLSDDDLITPFIRLGSFYKYQGFYPQAQPWYEKGKAIAEKRLDKDNSDVATVYDYLAGLYESQGRYSEAESLFQQAIEIVKIALPENHPEVAIHLNNLAGLYKSQGRYSEAEPLYLQAIEIVKIALPENHLYLATSLNNLGLLYQSQGRYSEVEPLFQQAIEIDKIALPENHPSLAIDFNNLAGLYYFQGRYSEAEPLFQQAIQIDKIALPENHPYLATLLNNLANLYRSQGRYSETEPLFQQAIEIDKIALPENHPSLAIDFNNLALLYESQGRYSEAESLFQQAIEINKIALPENHPSLAIDFNN
ncbi:tetratricopeptide repeat protein, partial [Dapis sp. BLCC M126]|uniref:tetratricopeptide repeat protein n=1 Tax=Dapis sp. BLCC M126 TaxID=3400189 RepID=UPI003CE86E9C